GMSEEEFRSAVRGKLLRMIQNNGNRQRLVPVDEIDRYLSEGWEFVAALPDGRAVIKLPQA
ncbi:MAG: hypothetical protein QW356_09210, partial [Candidatus Hadarchaeales archaeon]